MKAVTPIRSHRYGCKVHALTPRALRDLLGIGERRAAKLAHVSRDTLRRYEIHPDLVKTRAKRWLCECYYADLATHVASAERRAREVSAGLFDDVEEPEDEDGPRTIPAPACAA